MTMTAESARAAAEGGATTPRPLRFVGQRRKRSDAPERLTGQVRYTDDLVIPGALHARPVRGLYASARIVSMDTTVALAIPGVVSVLTARDLPVADIEQAIEANDIPMALDRTVFAGQIVAMVLAESAPAAEDGAAAVVVQYEPFEVVLDPARASAPGAPIVRGQRDRDEAELAMHGAAPDRVSEVKSSAAPNVVSQTSLQRGDVAVGFAESDVIVEREYRTRSMYQAPLEPQSCIARVDPLGNVEVYASTQALFHVRTSVAQVLGLPEHQVRVVAMPVGGGFGAKFGLLEPLVAALARAVRRPVRLVYTRLEDFVAGNPAPGTVIRVRAGGKVDGTLAALEADLTFDSGSHAGSPLGIAGLMLGSLYRWQHVRITGREVLTHKVPRGAYRAPGATQAIFALESTMDELARQLGLDAYTLRRQNAAREGDVRADGTKWPLLGLQQCLERAEPLYRTQLAARGPHEGVGIALGGWQGGIEPSSAVCRLNADGSLQVVLGSVDLTGTNSLFETIAAEEFGVDPSRVRVTTADSDAAPFAGATGGSKTTYTVGPSVMRAARDAREQALKVAAEELESAVGDLEVVGDAVQVRGVPDKRLTLAQIARLSASFGARYEPVFGRGQAANSQRQPGTGVHIVRVRVDPDTGRVRLIHYTVVQDVGRAINPALVEGQIIGGAMQGVGWGLYEGMEHDEAGNPITASFMDYTLPRATHAPVYQVETVEVPTPYGPYGAKGVGEPPVVPGPAAIANAVRDAIGARVTELPLTPERVYQAMTALRPSK